VSAHNTLYPTTDAERQDLADKLTQQGLIPTQSQRKMDKVKIESMANAMQDGSFDYQAAALEPILLTRQNEIYGGHHRIIAAQIAGVDVLSMPGQSMQLTHSSGVRPNYQWTSVLPSI
jgi:ParB-like nuclease domain